MSALHIIGFAFVGMNILSAVWNGRSGKHKTAAANAIAAFALLIIALATL